MFLIDFFFKKKFIDITLVPKKIKKSQSYFFYYNGEILQTFNEINFTCEVHDSRFISLFHRF